MAMPDRPLLNLPAPEPFTLRGRAGGGPSISRPSRERQREQRRNPGTVRTAAAPAALAMGASRRGRAVK